jgi:hypothetical protein
MKFSPNAQTLFVQTVNNTHKMNNATVLLGLLESAKTYLYQNKGLQILLPLRFGRI